MYNMILGGGYSSLSERRASGSRLVLLLDRIEERRSEV